MVCTFLSFYRKAEIHMHMQHFTSLISKKVFVLLVQFYMKTCKKVYHFRFAENFNFTKKSADNNGTKVPRKFRVYAVMENLEKSWNLNEWFPGLEKSWKMEMYHKKWHSGSTQNVIFLVIFWCTYDGPFLCARLGATDMPTSTFFPYFVRELM